METLVNSTTEILVRPTVIIHVEGGNIQSITTNQNIYIVVYDWDNIKQESKDMLENYEENSAPEYPYGIMNDLEIDEHIIENNKAAIDIIKSNSF